MNSVTMNCFASSSVTQEIELDEVVSKLQSQLKPGDWVVFEGELGAGKTTFVRHLLRAFGYEHLIISPTYPLLLEYEVGEQRFIHIDGFRLDGRSPDPWDFREWGDSIVLVEWAEKTQLPHSKFKFLVKIEFEADKRTRRISLFSV